MILHNRIVFEMYEIHDSQAPSTSIRILFQTQLLSVLKKKNTCPHVAHQIVIARPQVCRGILVFHRLKYKRFSSNQVFHQVNKLIRNGFWKSSS